MLNGSKAGKIDHRQMMKYQKNVPWKENLSALRREFFTCRVDSTHFRHCQSWALSIVLARLHRVASVSLEQNADINPFFFFNYSQIYDCYN